jgi:hypothetical protein
MAAEAVTTLKVDPGSPRPERRGAPNQLVELPIDVRIEGRGVRHRQNLAGSRIHDDGASTPRVIAGDAGFELTLGHVLEVLVDRQLERRSGGRRMFDSAERMAAGVGLDEHRPGLAANLCVVCRLDATQARVVDPDVTEQVRRQLLVRIEPAILLHETDAVQIQRTHAPGLLRRHLTPDVRERASLAELRRKSVALD